MTAKTYSSIYLWRSHIWSLHDQQQHWTLLLPSQHGCRNRGSSIKFDSCS